MIKNLFVYCLNLPLYYMMYIIKPRKNLWVFGAWFGEKYFDNPRFFFEYIKENDKNIKVIWITKDKNICDGETFIYKYSFKAVYYALIAEVFIITHSTYADLFLFINSNTRYVIQLWHGIPIKKIENDDSRVQSLKGLKALKRKLILLIFPFMSPKYSMTIASSESDQKNMKTAFYTKKDRVVITGYPRNDIFAQEKKIDTGRYKVLYAPTLRNGINDEVNLFDGFAFNKEKILQLLESKSIYLHIKMHPANKIDTKFRNSIKSEYITFLESKVEINAKINEYNLIISDYSGIYVDYLLTNKPIIFAPFDYEKYIIQDRELYYDYNKVTPGPKCRNWNEVFSWIENFKNNSSLYAEEREKIKNKFHKYQDGKNCERVYTELLKLKEEVNL